MISRTSISGWEDCAACFLCEFRHWNWTGEQIPSKLHLDNSPHCPMAQGCSTLNIPYTPDLNNLSEAGRSKVTDYIISMLPSLGRLQQEEMKTKIAITELTKLRDDLEDASGVDYRLRHVPHQQRPSLQVVVEETAEVQPSAPADGTKIIYYAHEQDRDGSPRSVAHTVTPKLTVASKSGVPDSYRREEKRISTFSRWNDPQFKIRDITRSGFFFTGKGRDLKCAFCGGMVTLPKSARGFNIAEKHKRSFPTCPIVLKLEVGNVPFVDPVREKLSKPNEEPHNAKIDSSHIGETVTEAKYPTYASPDLRLATFINWPQQSFQQKDLLIECGFFSLGGYDGSCESCNRLLVFHTSISQNQSKI